jgi:hypothetical protein
MVKGPQASEADFNCSIYSFTEAPRLDAGVRRLLGGRRAGWGMVESSASGYGLYRRDDTPHREIVAVIGPSGGDGLKFRAAILVMRFVPPPPAPAAAVPKGEGVFVPPAPAEPEKPVREFTVAGVRGEIAALARDYCMPWLNTTRGLGEVLPGLPAEAEAALREDESIEVRLDEDPRVELTFLALKDPRNPGVFCSVKRHAPSAEGRAADRRILEQTFTLEPGRRPMMRVGDIVKPLGPSKDTVEHCLVRQGQRVGSYWIDALADSIQLSARNLRVPRRKGELKLVACKN